MRLQAHVHAAPLNAHQFAALLQQLCCVLAPDASAIPLRLQRQQILQIAAQRRTHIPHSIGRVPLQLFLNLRSLIAACQPHHGDQHADDQRHQHRP